MKKYYRILPGIGAVLLVGAFFSFLMMAQTGSLLTALLIGYVYALSFSGAFWLVYEFLGEKLVVFTAGQQWILRTLLYTIAFVAAYLTGLVFQTLLLLPAGALQDILTQQLWQGFVNLVTLPFRRGASPSFFGMDIRPLLIPFFAVLFLIGMVSLMGSFVQVRWQQHRQQASLQQAELAALRAQIEPHFLFNSLNTIASLIRSQPDRAEYLIVQLSLMLRYLFQNTSRETIEFERELEFTRQYLELLRARFGGKLIVQWEDLSVSRNFRSPVLLLQPLIENAVQHGWENREQPLQITISIKESEGNVRLTVADNGKGISREQLSRLPVPGHALANISERLALTYHKKNLLSVESAEGQGVTVTIDLPVGKS
ncbi:MAG: sensor histidine kinase [Calditrichia bacterium]